MQTLAAAHHIPCQVAHFSDKLHNKMINKLDATQELESKHRLYHTISSSHSAQAQSGTMPLWAAPEQWAAHFSTVPVDHLRFPSNK
eukprot:5520578-Ditylum_brightwellii.AAC.1